MATGKEVLWWLNALWFTLYTNSIFPKRLDGSQTVNLKWKHSFLSKSTLYQLSLES